MVLLLNSLRHQPASNSHIGLYQARPVTDELLKKIEAVGTQVQVFYNHEAVEKALVGSEVAISTVHMAMQTVIVPAAIQLFVPSTCTTSV
ncbi:uncharacterized protein IUM83_03456 [Phytophthora cinnamomi]|uniref:uncharacterized protein n=1 Tax=Phytophthora cinnamomi TaxID=4785 RepID=UPI0035599354|nr:hypothetical protein IUM83_03456 [Phytophthora cinnamomi]